jgi:hypothetical protein
VAFSRRWEGEGRWRSAGEEIRRGKKFGGIKNVKKDKMYQFFNFIIIFFKKKKKKKKKQKRFHEGRGAA